ncbi:MAG: S9 family peptidase [Deltaproteobacteria bacterium]|nr:MAG: S9 family peptidase [Deltaproteobacteria bacterium]
MLSILLASLSLSLASPLVEPLPEAPEVPAPRVRVDGALRFQDIPEVDQQIVDRLQPWQAFRSASFSGLSAAEDGGLYVLTRFGATAQLHHVAQPGGARVQLTFEAEPIASAIPHPTNPDLVVTQRDVGGNEAWQYELLDRKSGARTLLTDGASRNEGFSWSPDGARFAFFSTARNGTDFDLYLGQTAQPNSAQLTVENQGMWRLTDWGPGDRSVLMFHYESITRSALYQVDLKTKERRRLSAEGDVAVSGGTLAPDGRTVYFTSDHEGEFQSLYTFDLVSSELTPLAPDLTWDVEGFTLSPDGRTLAFSVNERGYSKLFLFDTRRKRRTEPTSLPAGRVSNLSFHKQNPRLLGLSVFGATSPSDAWTLDVRRDHATRWTQSETGGLDPSSFVEPELITWTSFDGLELDAMLYRPEGPGPHPVVISIHGGPESQSRPFLASTYQVLVKEVGCAVLVPNVRGSRGYGKTFLTLDNAEKREDSVKDIGTLLDWIAKEPTLDEGRVGVRGGSYGGYMVLASMIHFGDRLAAGLNVVGISDFITFLENTKSYRRDLRRVEYGDERDPEMRAFLQSISPLRRATEITPPLFVVHGANDPRVPIGEAEQIVEAVRSEGRTVWYLRAENEGHGFRRKENRDVATALEMQFFGKMLDAE